MPVQKSEWSNWKKSKFKGELQKNVWKENEVKNKYVKERDMENIVEFVVIPKTRVKRKEKWKLCAWLIWMI
jgi:hypothetical protein